MHLSTSLGWNTSLKQVHLIWSPKNILASQSITLVFFLPNPTFQLLEGDRILIQWLGFLAKRGEWTEAEITAMLERWERHGVSEGSMA